MAGPHSVYRWFDADGNLLYIGKAVDPVKRWSSHRAEGRWWTRLAVRREDEWYPSEKEAARAEGVAIGRERPPGNQVGYTGARRDSSPAFPGMPGVMHFRGDESDPSTWVLDMDNFEPARGGNPYGDE